jgi:diguanylate cyclase (GGDEF)-like protein
MAAVDAVDAQHGKALQADKLWAGWKHQARAARSRGTPSFEQYNQLTKSLTALVAQVANTSNLILDPDLDSYYLMDVVVVRQPTLLDQVGQAVELATSDDRKPLDHELLAIARSNIRRTADAIASDLTTSFDNTDDPRVQAAAAQPGAAFADIVELTLRKLASVPAEGQTTLDVSALLASASTLNAVSSKLFDDLIADRIAVLEHGVRTTTQVLLLLAAVLMLLATGRIRALQTVRKQTDELRHQAMHDAQTGLANRAAFDATLPRMLKARRAGGRGPALLLLDLDAFKTVNDRYGHHVGDHLLLLTAQRLTALVRGNDLVARLGGDEFAVIVDDSDARGALVMAERITAAICEPADLGGVQVTPAVSVGVYLPDVTADAEHALICADAAMYFAKSTGGGYQLFDPERHRSFIERYQLELELRAAPQLGQLELHYQPIVDLTTLHVVAVEALIRWNHPTRGLLYPDDFIKVAEESGAIVDLGRWVLAQACADGRLLVADLPDDRPFTIAVNLSRRQLTSNTLGDNVLEALLAHGLPPERLTLEVTETALMHDEEVMMGLLHKLKALGVALAMDDFGTGYSSLAQLRTMPIDVLKIDKVFIGGIASGEEEWAFAAAIIRLANSLGKRTLAEGVEHSSQLVQLRSLGCELGQGYLFGRPMPLCEVIGLLAEPHQETPLPLGSW